MSRAKDFMKIIEQAEEKKPDDDLKSIIGEFAYGLSTELDHNAGNLSTGPDAATGFELSNDQGDNWFELQLWDKNRFDTPIGSIRYVCGMKANEDSVTLSSGKGIEKILFNNKDEEIEKIPDIKEKEDYKDKIQRIRRVFLGFQLNITGVAGIPNDQNSFETMGKKVGEGIIKRCAPYL